MSKTSVTIAISDRGANHKAFCQWVGIHFADAFPLVDSLEFVTVGADSDSVEATRDGQLDLATRYRVERWLRESEARVYELPAFVF